MMRRVSLTIICILLFIGQVSASTLTIDSDKILNISGNRTFPVFLYDICHSSYITDCYPQNVSMFTFSAQIGYKEGDAWYDTLQTKHAGYSYWTSINVNSTGAHKNVTATQRNGSAFFGYMQKDEPNGLSPWTFAQIYNNYNMTKSFDPDHPVIINIAENAEIWYPTGDILTWDRYTIRNDTTEWERGHAILAWELMSSRQVFDIISIEGVNKPVWTVLQANGVFAIENVSTGKGLFVPEPNELRAMTWAAISTNVTGIGYWPYNDGGTTNEGLSQNASLLSYVKNFTNETTGYNDILILPTYANSWYGKQNFTAVNLSPNPNVTVATYPVPAFFYMLKKNATANKYYLFIVNKGNTSVSNVQITINDSIVGGRTVKTLGGETSGSQAANRVLFSTNGVFTDSFDAYAAHVYEIEMNATADTFDVWLDNVDLGADTTNLFYNFTALTPNTTYNISIRTHNLTYDSYSTWVNQTTTTNASVFIPPAPIWVSNNTGYYWANHTWQAGVGNGTDSYNISVNGTWYNGTLTSFNSSLLPLNWSNITVWAWNNTGYMSATNITNNSQAPASPSYIPPAPTWVSNITGSYWANHTWSAGSGNITNSYNVSVNGTWYNSTATFFNSSLVPAGCSNITVWAYNNTGATSTTNISNNSCVSASSSYAPSITSYSPVDLTPSYSIGALATFEAGSNQSVSWTWTGATEGAGDGTTNSTATQTWLTAGAKTVTVTCSNANGSCGTIQWDVTVDPDPAAGYNISGYVTYVNTSPVEGARIRVWGAENTSDVNGYYALYGLSSGNYTILFEKDYYYDGVARIVLTDNATQNYTFVSKVHVSTPGFTGILALLSILLIVVFYRHRNH